MIEIKQKEDIGNVVAFHHTIKFTIGPRAQFAKSAFITRFQYSMVEWEIVIDRRSPTRFFHLTHVEQQGSTNFHIRLQETGWREVFPNTSLIEFKVNVFDEDGKECINPMKYTIKGLVRQENSFSNRRNYITDPSSDFAVFLTQIFEDDEFHGKVFELCTRIEYTKEEMLSAENLNSGEAAPVPIELDYTFDSISNPTRFDFKIYTTNRRFFLNANKEMLYIASDYFRDRLNLRNSEIVEDTESLEALDIVITYMITGKYKAPKKMSPELAKEMINLATRFKVMNPKLFKNTVERHCYQELVLNTEDALYVVNMMIIAQDKSLSNLLNSCVACILTHHFHQFLDEFVEGNHPLKERIITRRAVFTPSLAMVVKKGFSLHSEVRSFTRQLVPFVEH